MHFIFNLFWHVSHTEVKSRAFVLVWCVCVFVCVCVYVCKCHKWAFVLVMMVLRIRKMRTYIKNEKHAKIH